MARCSERVFGTRESKRFLSSKGKPCWLAWLATVSARLVGFDGVNFLNFLGFQVLPSVFVLYAGYRYGWGTTTVGLALAIVGVSNIIVQGVLVRPFIARFGERAALLTGLAFGAASFVVYGLAPDGILFMTGVVVYAPIGLAGPAVQGLMTRRVGPTEQGRLQGANSSIMGLTGVIGPGMFTFIFALFISAQSPISLPGAPFLLAGLLALAALLLAVQVTRRSQAKNQLEAR